MDSIRFEISCEYVDNSLEIVYYSDTLSFRLKEYDGDKLVFDGEVTLNDIKRGITEIPISLYDKIQESFFEYIDEHNEGLASHSLNVRFEITDIDSRFAYTYKKYLNDKLIKEGKGWAKDITNPTEREAWDKAVIQYKSSHGIKMPTDMMKDGIQSVKDAIGKLDLELPNEMELIPPLIETAIPKLKTNPCEFVNDVIQASNTLIAKIKGMPSPKELANYYVKLAKDNVASAYKKIADQEKPTVELAFVPVADSYERTYEYFEQIDAENEEFLKRYADEKCLFDVMEQKEPEYVQLLKKEVLTTNSSPVTVNGGKRNEVIKQLGFTGSDSKSYCDSKMAWNTIVKTLAGNKRITVHKDLVSEVQSIFEEIYNIGFNVKLIGGYVYRTINNPNYPNSKKLSMHSFGCAIDINWEDNPFSRSQKRPFEYPPSYWRNIKYNENECIWTYNHPVVKIFESHEWGWGGRYGDFMHFSKANGG